MKKEAENTSVTSVSSHETTRCQPRTTMSVVLTCSSEIVDEAATVEAATAGAATAGAATNDCHPLLLQYSLQLPHSLSAVEEQRLCSHCISFEGRWGGVRVPLHLFWCPPKALCDIYWALGCRGQDVTLYIQPPKRLDGVMLN
jgi:hypothetical protein